MTKEQAGEAAGPTGHQIGRPAGHHNDTKIPKKGRSHARKNHTVSVVRQYGLSWQIVPNFIHEVVNARDPEKSNRVMQALLSMKKLDIKTLKAAATTGGPNERGNKRRAKGGRR